MFKCKKKANIAPPPRLTKYSETPAWLGLKERKVCQSVRFWLNLLLKNEKHFRSFYTEVPLSSQKPTVKSLVKIGSETAELLRTRVKEVLKKGKVEITIGMQIPC